ncbi:hypothetical protein M011DRAFT_458561 [Sporormia fimetaria CBS 119925]|uniref:RNase H type-1 domain-containing protein n=1 Tax=Sporormia fimetaria CBS 119925 TaxID=1340428 RepID=A0A6A6VCH0_9PLEO|nr:hypothetical protein M011DRAFT_458561 [Sporormia fimetaria CBS 119925]
MGRKSRAGKRNREVQTLTAQRPPRGWKRQRLREIGIEEEYQIAMCTPIEPGDIKSITPANVRSLLFPKYLRTPRGTVPTFPGRLEIFPAMEAIEAAYGEHTSEKYDTGRLVFWTDGGASRGAAVVYRLTLALAAACQLAMNHPGRFKSVAIYTDNTNVLHHLKHPLRTQSQNYLWRKAKLLRTLGPELSLHWVPAHSKVPGNELADRVATYAARYVYDIDDEIVEISPDSGSDAALNGSEAKLPAEVGAKSKTISQLEEFSKFRNREVDGLKATGTELKRKIRDRQNQIQILETQVGDLEEEVTLLKTKLSEAEEREADLMKDISNEGRKVKTGYSGSEPGRVKGAISGTTIVLWNTCLHHPEDLTCSGIFFKG